MKKSSTQALVLAALLAVSTGSSAQSAGGAPAQAAAPSTVAPTRGPLQLADDVPDKHVVVRGDTLWDIAGKFLREPWRWPEIWELNREQIRNPHLIYPGDIVYLDRSGDRPRLRLGRPVGGSSMAAGGAGLPTERLSPSVRKSPAARDGAIPTIDPQAIEPFLNRPLITDEKGLADRPRIMATQEGRVYLGRGDIAYVRGLPADDKATDYHVFRSARPILDPATREPLAYEAMFVGTARVEQRGDPATIRITSQVEEIGRGDRLLAFDRPEPVQYAPRAPEAEVRGRVVSLYRGVAQTGPFNVVALDVGAEHKLEVGHVLAIRQAGATVVDRESPVRGEKVKLPDETVGHLLVFRVFDRMAYGLIMAARGPVSVGDTVVNP